MELTREIYWNVGHGVIIPMYVLAFVAFIACAWGFWRRVPVYRLGKPINRLDQLSLRITCLLKNLLAQTKVVRVLGPGIPHALFFWSFGLLFIGTVLIMAQADFTDLLFHVRFLKGVFYEYYSLILDVAGGVAIIMLCGLLVRRFIIKPVGLQTTRDDYIAHVLLLAIIITGFLVEAVRMAATELRINPDLASFSPVGMLVGRFLEGMTPESLLLSHKVLWWVHLFLALGFIAVIPFIKLRHIFTTGGNYLFADLGPKGAVASINMEDESILQYGAVKVSDLTWKDIFDADACTSCKRCQDRCPAWATDKPLSPMKVVQQIGEIAFSAPDKSLCSIVTKEVLWSCTTCRACQEICPASIEHVNKIIEMRRNLTLMEGAFPGDEVRNATANIEVNGNPFGLGYAGRGDWAEGLEVSIMEQDAEVDVLYFVGCYASFDIRNRKVARSFLNLCQTAGIRVGILGKEEKCCGDPVRKQGNEYLYQCLANENIALIKSYGVKKIVTTCPHCFNTLCKDYRDLGLDVPIEHYTTFLHGLLLEGRLQINSERFTCTYHDSCYLGRYNDVYAPPRALIVAAGGSITEMEKNKTESFCCGAGGGRILAEENLGSRINVKRTKMAADAGTPTVLSSCPFCLTMFEDGVKGAELEGQLFPRDIAEILAERLAT